MRQWATIACALAALGMAGPLAAAVPEGAEDDLAIVKKAVASPAPGAAREARPATRSAKAAMGGETVGRVAAVAQAAPAVAEAPPARAGRAPRWFKVRVVEKGTGRKKVTVNLPLSLVRALGDDTIDWGCRGDGDRQKCHTVRLSEVLRSLEAGQELVEVDDDNATVKVWVE